MLTYSMAKLIAEDAINRWLKMHGIKVTSHSIVVDKDTIDAELYDSLIEEIAIEFEDVG